MPNPAYPNGQCGACGRGASTKGTCTNRSCCNYKQVVVDDPDDDGETQ